MNTEVIEKMRYCLGTVQFGMDYGIMGSVQPTENKVFEMLSYAINNGVCILDTAAAYGEAEKIIGEYLNAYPEMLEKIRIVSKLRPDAFLQENVDKWSDIAVFNAKESIERLGITKFKAYLFHNASYIFDDRAVTALSKVKAEGFADLIGVSIYNPNEAMKALSYPDIDVIQIPYNLFDHRLDKCGFFDKARSQGVTVFARSSLLQGLAMMDPGNLPESVSFAKEYIEKFRELCDKYDQGYLNTAIGYVGGKEGIDYVVFGVDNIAQLKEYINIKDIELSKEMTKEIDLIFENVEEKLVNPVLWK